jgi:hypothetical protein
VGLLLTATLLRRGGPPPGPETGAGTIGRPVADRAREPELPLVG